MAGPRFRLLRLNHTDTPLSYEYLASCKVGAPARFTPDINAAHEFTSWEEFVAAAVAVWLVLGPCDLMYENVPVVSGRAV